TPPGLLLLQRPRTGALRQNPTSPPRERPARKNSRAAIQILRRRRADDARAPRAARTFSSRRNSSARAGGNRAAVPTSAVAHARLCHAAPACPRERARNLAAHPRAAPRKI